MLRCFVCDSSVLLTVLASNWVFLSDFERVGLLYSSSNHAESILRGKIGPENVSRRPNIYFSIVKIMLKQKEHVFSDSF